jgi:hypothetical protein
MLKNRIYLLKYVLLVEDLSHGVRNGKKYGMKLNTALTDVEMPK